MIKNTYYTGSINKQYDPHGVDWEYWPNTDELKVKSIEGVATFKLYMLEKIIAEINAGLGK